MKSKGSSADVGRAIQVGTATALGNSSKGSIAKTIGGLLGGGVYQNFRRRYLNNPKTLKKYLNPKLLKEMTIRKGEMATEPFVKVKRKGIEEKGND